MSGRRDGVSIEIKFDEAARRIFVFDEVYSERAAREQAEKRKLGAFGTVARMQSLIAGGPKPETVSLSKSELRYEPFWLVSAQRAVDYTCQVEYTMAVDNAHAQRVQIGSFTTEVAARGSKRQIVVPALETCHRKIDFATHLDGLKREIRAATLEAYVRNYKAQDVEAMTASNAVESLVSVASVIQIATSRLTGEAITAHEIGHDQLLIDKLYLYWRPVFAFEYVWTANGKTGVVEIDGLTGDGVSNGQWFKDKLQRVMTRDMLIEVSSEVANAVVPGTGVAVKLIDRML
ncbi:hypothetical protein [uncultured Aquincola sp.]|uniref:hypothetical protein n=1 Tax=uncultured Aquincola sp. TaxID=886556 RepID=UPI0032B27432